MNAIAFIKIQKMLVCISSIALFGIFTGGCQESPQKYAGAVDKLIVAAYEGDTGALVYVAQAQGYFTDNGLEVTVNDYEAGKLAADALLAGEADICTSADFVLTSNSFEHDNLRVLATVALADVNGLVARKDSGINQPGDLNGKKVGITKKSVAEFFLGTFLIFHGLSVQDVKTVDLKPSQIIDAVTNGNIDAGLTWEPNIFTIKKRLGSNATSWPGQSGRDFYFLLLAKMKFIDQNRQVVERFLRALIRAEEFAKNNVAETKTFLRTRFHYTSEYTDYSWKRHDFTVALPQALLVAMEDQARWRIKSKLTKATAIPNYLNFIYIDGLERVKPQAVGIIR